MILRLLKNGLVWAALTVVMYVLAGYTLSTVQRSNAPLFHATSEVLKWRGGGSWQRFQQFDPTEELDVLFIGSSHAYRGYDPMIFKEHGHSSFNLGTSSQSAMHTYFILRDVVDLDKVGLVVLDVYEEGLMNQGLESTADLTQNIPSDKAAWSMGLAMKDPRALNMLLLRTFRAKEPLYMRSDPMVAGAVIKDSLPPEIVEYDSEDESDVNAMQLRYFRCIIELCERKDVPLVLVDHPAPTAANKQRHLEYAARIRDEIKPHDLVFIDMAFDHGLPLDDRTHFYDDNHLNRAGVDLFNAALINELEARGILRKSEPMTTSPN